MDHWHHSVAMTLLGVLSWDFSPIVIPVNLECIEGPQRAQTCMPLDCILHFMPIYYAWPLCPPLLAILLPAITVPKTKHILGSINLYTHTVKASRWISNSADLICTVESYYTMITMQVHVYSYNVVCIKACFVKSSHIMLCCHP